MAFDPTTRTHRINETQVQLYLGLWVQAPEPGDVYVYWLLSMVERAESTLRAAFDSGPRSGEQRYRARAASLARFHGTLRGAKSPLPELRDHYREQKLQKEDAHANG